MTPWFKIGFILGSLLLAGIAGWHLHTWYDGAKLARQLQDAENQRVAIEKKYNDASKKYEELLTEERLKNQTLTQQWEMSRANSKDCPLPASGIRLLKAAIRNGRTDTR